MNHSAQNLISLWKRFFDIYGDARADKLLGSTPDQEWVILFNSLTGEQINNAIKRCQQRAAEKIRLSEEYWPPSRFEFKELALMQTPPSVQFYKAIPSLTTEEEREANVKRLAELVKR